MSNITIVGGAGFVGHHLALALKSDVVTCIDSLMVNNLNVIDNPLHRSMAEQRLALLRHANVLLELIDARDYHALSRAMSHRKPDIIVHLAAVAHIDRANKNPWNCFDQSLRTLENSLDVARSLNAGIVYFSSSTVYGDFSASVIDEDEELTPVGIYGNLKLAGERMCIAYHQTYGLPVTIIRPQALYGPRCVSGRVTQVFIERAMRGETITIHGDGSEKHDFTCIDDLVAGMKLVLASMSDGLRIYNLTGECATGLRELAEIVTERFPVSVEYGPKDPEKPARGTMSCKRIRFDLGYEPKVDIRTGMNRYMDSYAGENRKTA